MTGSGALSDTETETTRRPVPSRRTGVSLVRLGSLPANSEQDLRWVQDRLALFSKTAFLITAMFLVADVLLGLWLVDRAYVISPAGRVGHVAATLLALGLWRATQGRRQLSPALLQRLDAVGTIGVCLAFAFMGYHAAQPYGFYTALLAILHVNVGRAAVVPSVPGRSLLIGLASFAGLIVARALLLSSPDAAHSGLQLRALIEAVLWSAAGAGVATLASRVIYGLHERALEARQLGQYQLEEKIGQGGMGEIYRARHAMLRRPTAIKLLTGNGSEQQLRRFEKEVQLTARLTHPNTISVYDYGRTPDGTFYYAMELLDGLTVEQLVERHGPQPASRAIHILMQVCGALVEAHGVGLIHRDIKPANIYLCRRGGVPDVVKVLDFGLVREIKSAASLTQSNLDVIVGTPLYLSPEAILSPERVDARADLYGLGAVAYFLLTGSPPFSGKGVVEICGHHLHTPPEPPSRRTPVPHDLEALVLACLSKAPEARPASAGELLEALRACQDAALWTTSDAESWWSKFETAVPAARVQEPSGEQPRKTICCIDLEQRLAKRQQSA
jgi:eukaryotic-like serine/threonine-protein kinase